MAAETFGMRVKPQNRAKPKVKVFARKSANGSN